MLHSARDFAKRRTSLEVLESRCLLTCSAVCISEFLASNQETSTDSFGKTPDWIEIYNPTDTIVDLEGWSLTDDPGELAKWQFSESTLLASQGRIIVWASDRDMKANDQWHTNFKLSAAGDYIALVRPDSTIVSAYGEDGNEYPTQSTDVSYGTDSNGDIRYFLNPTPGRVNGVGTLGFVEDTKFSVDRGFYDEPFSLELSSATVNATLVYTLDGSEPTTSNGTEIVGNDQGTRGTIMIDSTTTVRAMAFRDGWEPTNVDTQSFVFLDQVIRQTGDGLPNTWGHDGADYEMDQSIVNNSRYENVIVDGLRSIPTLSLVSDIDNWFGRRGIYPTGSGNPVPVSAELLLGDGADGFQVDGSVEIQGGSSTNRWKSDKLSMQLKFKREFGDGKLEYPLFGEEATSRFDTLTIDARLNQAWHYGGGSSPTSQRDRAQYARDQFVADLQNELGGYAPHGQWVHVYLNGIYWGIHNLHERPDEHFAADYLGGSDDDYDIIKHNNDVVNGSFTEYGKLLAAVNGNTSSSSNYAQIEDMLEIDEFIDYMQVNYFVGNTDWAHHNWYASFNKVDPAGKWRFHSWDAEHVLKGVNDDATGRDDAQGPTHIHRRLMLNSDYALKFMDAVQENFFNGGVLTVDNAMEKYQLRTDHVYEAIVPESARWGDNRRSRPYTRDSEWVAERDRLLEDYFPRRTAIVVEQMRDRGFFHRFNAPQFSQHGGEVDEGFELSIRGTGSVFYTTDGSDPRTSETRSEYSEAIPISGFTTVKTRSMVGREWSALVEAKFAPNRPSRVGDFNGDELLSEADLDLLLAAIADNSSNDEFDLDLDGVVNNSDADYWIVELAKTRRGDTNLDGKVNFADFLALSANFGSSNANWRSGDFNGDDKVTFEDFLMLSSEFGFDRDS